MEESIKSSKSKSTTSESRSLLLMIKVGRQKTGLRNIAENLIRGGGRAYSTNECRRQWRNVRQKNALEKRGGLCIAKSKK